MNPRITISPELAKALSRVANITQPIRDAISNIYGKNPELLKTLLLLSEATKNLPIRIRQSWAIAVENGWYPNGETTAIIERITDAGPEAIDAFMIKHLREDWKSIKESILHSQEERSEILDCAFALHEEGRYIASVPLFISQAEGIIADNLGLSIFMNKKEKEEKISKKCSDLDDLDSIFISLIGMNTQLHAGSRENDPEKKRKSPNRNGILHGSRKHLDYGTEINSLKALSLLAFASFVSTAAPPEETR